MKSSQVAIAKVALELEERAVFDVLVARGIWHLSRYGSAG